MTVELGAAEALNYVEGEWVRPTNARFATVIDPATEEPIGTFPESGTADVDMAVDAAEAAFRGWRQHPAPRRAEILFRAAEELVRRKEELAREMSIEMGKVIEESRGDVQETIDLAYYFAGEGRRLFGLTTPSESRQKSAQARRVPVGVVAAISPFNFPLAIPALKALPALIAGNTVVLKPSTDTPLIARRLVEILEAAGLPPGVLNLVYGRGEVVGRRLIEHPKVSLVSFTGSRASGIEISRTAADGLKNVILELGGKNCIIVMDDAQMDLAVRGVTWSAFGTSGQRCTAASRVIVHRAIYPEFVERLGKMAAGLRLGPGHVASTDVGPVVNRTARDRVMRYIGLGREEGATVVSGGARPDRPGYFIEPTVFADARRDMKLVTDEIFGPVTAVMPAEDLDEAIELANATEYGLSAAIYTENIRNAMIAADEVQTGLFYVNAGTIGAEAHLPSGGMKHTGNGHREAGVAAIDAYTEWRSIYVDYSNKLQRAQIDLD